MRAVFSFVFRYYFVASRISEGSDVRLRNVFAKGACYLLITPILVLAFFLGQENVFLLIDQSGKDGKMFWEVVNHFCLSYYLRSFFFLISY